MKLTQLSRGRFGLCKDNNLPVGEIYREVDGFFVFWPYTVTGFYSEGFLREVADKLRDLNKEWNETIERELSMPQKQPNPPPTKPRPKAPPAPPIKKHRYKCFGCEHVTRLSEDQAWGKIVRCTNCSAIVADNRGW